MINTKEKQNTHIKQDKTTKKNTFIFFFRKFSLLAPFWLISLSIAEFYSQTGRRCFASIEEAPGDIFKA